MNKNIFSILLLFIIFLKSFSQQKDKISIEGGTSINKPLIKGERMLSNGESTTSFDWTTKYYNSTGYYFKIGVDQKLTSRNKWSTFFSIGGSFISHSNKYHRKGYTDGCFGGESANELRYIYNKSINIFYGPSLQFENKAIRFSSNIIFNCFFTYKTKIHSIPRDQNASYTYTIEKLQYNSYLSSQFMILYNIRNNIWIGPSCEIFYINGSYIYNKIHSAIKGNNYYSNSYPETSIAGKNIWINPAIKLQIDLK